MPETTSPREKVGAAVREASRSQWNGGIRVSSAKWCNHLTDAILAALASSGDHAGLKRLADEAADFGVPAKVDPAVLNALIAEVAALRQKADASEAHWEAWAGAKVAEAQRAEHFQLARSTKAERKLAEVVATLEVIANEDSPFDVIKDNLLARISKDLGRRIDLARTFLSKEAERG